MSILNTASSQFILHKLAKTNWGRCPTSKWVASTATWPMSHGSGNAFHPAVVSHDWMDVCNGFRHIHLIVRSIPSLQMIETRQCIPWRANGYRVKLMVCTASRMGCCAPCENNTHQMALTQIWPCYQVPCLPPRMERHHLGPSTPSRAIPGLSLPCLLRTLQIHVAWWENYVWASGMGAICLRVMCVLDKETLCWWVVWTKFVW